MAVYVSKITLRGTRPEGLNPLPRFRRMTGFSLYDTTDVFPEEAKANLGARTVTLPYMMQDRYGRDLREITLKTVVLENRFLKATFTPEVGGKLWSVFDKIQSRELLFANPVLRPANLAIRDAWTSGGIEWNFGSLGHTYFCCDDVFAAILKSGSGEDFLRIYEFERAKECVWQADFHLPDDSKLLYSHVRLFNCDDVDKTTYWWSNIALPEDGNTRVLSSSDVVTFVPGGRVFTCEKLPYLSVMPGDLSYPKNVSRSFDYFFLPGSDVRTAWECAVNKDGLGLFDRSAAPLVYHKMFCWGNHRGGARWQEYLSEPGMGEYIEIQAGLAESQLHDKPFPARSELEWAQCYGGIRLDRDKVHGVSLTEANRHAEKIINEAVTEEALLSVDRTFRKDAAAVMRKDDIVHFASGWGALEAMLERSEGQKRLPDSVCFPEETLGKEQKTWIGLLKDGILTETDPSEIPGSWMTSEKWRRLTEESLKKPGGRNWLSLLHYGNMLFEHWDDTVIARIAAKWPESEKKRFEKAAEEAWKESDRLAPNVWAKRNLAVLEELRGNDEGAEAYYDALFESGTAKADFSFCAEYLAFLNRRNKYEKAWKLFESMPEEIRSQDRVALSAALCATRLGKTEFALSVLGREHSAIREGETSLTDLWFECHARRIAEERGIPSDRICGKLLDELKEEAEETCPPPHAIDFRMSYDKKNKYRLSE